MKKETTTKHYFTKPLLVLFALCVILFYSNTAHAANMEPVTPNVPFTGQLETETSEHFYLFTVDKTGYFNIDFAPVDPTLDSKWGWDLTLYDYITGEEIYSYDGAKKAISTPTFNFQKGTQLYIKISADFDLADYAPINQQYSIQIKTIANAYWEQESNDTANTATVINSNITYYGNLYIDDDVDYYKYTIPSTGYFNIDFGIADVTADISWGWDVLMYDSSTNQELGNFTFDKKTTTSNFCFKKGTTLIFKLTPTLSDTNKHITYTLKINQKPTNYWEKESLLDEDSAWGIRAKNATTLKASKKYTGNLWSSSDNDLYKVATTKNGYVTLKFNPNEVASNLEWGYNVTLCSKSGKVIFDSSYTKTNVNQRFYLPKGTYYVELKATTSYAAPVLKDYTISFSSKAASPGKVKSLKRAKSKLSWKKASNASGYQISYATNKKFKKAKTITATKTRYAISKLNLKKNKIYYVKVRAYKETATGTKIYGSWSNTIQIKK